MSKEPACVRCNRLKDTHPSPACLHYVPPAPGWMVALNKVLAKVNQKI
jgi:hypothetical protein